MKTLFSLILILVCLSAKAASLSYFDALSVPGSGLTLNLVTSTNLPITNLTSTVFVFVSATNAITLNKELWTFTASGNMSITNTSGTGWATLAITNSAATSVTNYITNALWRAMGQATTNFAPSGGFIIPAARVGWVDLDNRAGYTVYSCVLQQ